MTIKKEFQIITSVIIIIIIALIFILRPNNTKPVILTEWPYYPDTKSITEEADVIIIGNVVSEKDVKSIQSRPYTISTVKVSRVIKGNVNIGDVISISQLGDYKRYPESTLQRIDGYLSKNDECLIFLAEFNNLPYTPLNPNQGIIWIQKGFKLYSESPLALYGYSDIEKSNEVSIETAIDEVSGYVDQ